MYAPFDFTPKLAPGKSIKPLAKGKTAKDRLTGKQDKRFQRIRDRSAADLASQKRSPR